MLSTTVPYHDQGDADSPRGEQRVYLIGAGAIARQHAKAIGTLPRPERVALSVADPDPTALAAFARDVPRARPFDDARAMLDEPPRPGDIVVVATPPVTHRDLTFLALDTGRHVLCEKPLAMDRAQALTMLDSARAHNRLLGCCSSRYLGVPTTEEVKRLIRTGELGRPYHVTWTNRNQRDRAGVEYQPTSRWPLDRGKSGGGIVQDWGPYDVTTLNDLLSPVQVDVLDAWLANPVTALDLPPGTVFDVEEHGGASLRYHLPDGAVVAVTYELSACTHGGARSITEVEGQRGAVRWDWLMLDGRGDVIQSRDRDGAVEMTTTQLAEDNLGAMDKPLYYFHRRVHGLESRAVVDEQAVFNFSCLRAIYDCAASGQPQSVTREVR